MLKRDLRSKAQGFTLVEMVIATAILTVVAGGILTLMASLVNAARFTKYKAVALTLATNQMEYLKSLPYDQLAIQGGTIYATSPLPASVDKTVDGFVYTVKSDIDYVDDAFDGCGTYPSTALKQKYCRNYPPPTGSSTDTNPKDYKVIDVTVYLKRNNKFLSQVSTNVAARVAETSSTTGALFITVIDDKGNPVSGATITVTNTTLTPNINQSDNSDINGVAIFYDLPPDTTNYDYTITASKTGYTSLTTIPPNGTLQPNYSSQQIFQQQSSLLTLTIKQKGADSLVVEATTPTGTPINNAKIYIKGGYKKYTAATNTAYYYDNLSPSDVRPTTDTNGLFAVSNLDPGDYIFCGDAGATSCTVGATTYYLVAALPYTGSNPFNPVTVPTYDPASPPTTTFSYNSANYYQKVRLILTTTANFPRIANMSPDEVSLTGGTINATAFVINGTNLPCTTNPATCQTTVRLKQGGNTYTASCTGTSGGLKLNCTVNLTGASQGQMQLEVVANGSTFTAPSGMLGGMLVLP